MSHCDKNAAQKRTSREILEDCISCKFLVLCPFPASGTNGCAYAGEWTDQAKAVAIATVSTIWLLHVHIVSYRQLTESQPCTSARYFMWHSLLYVYRSFRLIIWRYKQLFVFFFAQSYSRFLATFRISSFHAGLGPCVLSFGVEGNLLPFRTVLGPSILRQFCKIDFLRT
jgi:hypothetical protein